jgi:hypothetical protein
LRKVEKFDFLVWADYAPDEIAAVTRVLESGGERAEGGGQRTVVSSQ